MVNNEKAACLLNRSDEEKNVQVDFSVLLKANDNYWSSEPYKLENYSVRDLWEHKSVKLEGNTIYIKIPPHSVKVYRFKKIEKK